MQVKYVLLLFYSGSNEEGGGNQTETTGKIYNEQVSNSLILLLLMCLICDKNIICGENCFCLTLTVFNCLHYRLKKGKQLEKEEAITEVKKNIHLIKAPHAGGEESHCLLSFKCTLYIYLSSLTSKREPCLAP